MTLEITRGLSSMTLLLGLLLAAPGCGDGGGGDDMDGGTARVDGGGGSDDGGASDGGASTDDGGASTDDGGASTSDGGSAGSDGSVAQDGGPMGASCGGRGSPPCARGTFCLFPDTECGRFDGPGSCTVIPEACPDIFMPVCGCDGMTYGNRCEAYGAGVSVDSEGECGAVASGSCDEGLITCRRLPPTCGRGLYPEVNPTTRCWTDRCIPIDACECAAPSDCPMDMFACVGGRCAER